MVVMRNITEIVIHHSVSPRDQELEKSIVSFDKNHKDRLHPEENGFGLHIAYHFVIGGDGRYRATRPLNEVGYHASNLTVNKRSVGVCFCGNFDQETPSKEQMSTAMDIIAKLKENLPITKITGHRTHASKSCPGKNFTDAMIKSLEENKDLVTKNTVIRLNSANWGRLNVIEQTPNVLKAKEYLHLANEALRA